MLSMMMPHARLLNAVACSSTKTFAVLAFGGINNAMACSRVGFT